VSPRRHPDEDLPERRPSSRVPGPAGVARWPECSDGWTGPACGVGWLGLDSWRIVLADASLAAYPLGGGHWSAFLQYAQGLRALGHDVLWLQLLGATGDPATDQRHIRLFFRRFRHYGLGDRCALLCFDGPQDLESARLYGKTAPEIRDWIRTADLLWNFACAVRQPLLSRFKHPVLIDLDPGHLQVSSVTWDLDIGAHRAFLTVGTRLHDPGCGVPTLGVTWRPFLPFVFLPWWSPWPDPGIGAPFTSVTHWTWETLWWQDRVLSVSKRDAYLRYLTLPLRSSRPFELAVNLHPDDATGDRELLTGHGWRLAHPYRVAGSPAAYRRYIRRSRAELGCAKPLHRELQTGWFSDRSAAYLASGRPVLAEDTGFGTALPTGHGLLAFRTLDEAVAGVEEIDRRYRHHMQAARDLAVAHLDARRSLAAMLAASEPAR
jgi:hypothetical protein